MIKRCVVEMRQSKSGGKWSDFTDFNAGDGDFAKYPKKRGSSFFISHIHRA